MRLAAVMVTFSVGSAAAGVDGSDSAHETLRAPAPETPLKSFTFSGGMSLKVTLAIGLSENGLVFRKLVITPCESVAGLSLPKTETVLNRRQSALIRPERPAFTCVNIDFVVFKQEVVGASKLGEVFHAIACRAA